MYVCVSVYVCVCVSAIVVVEWITSSCYAVATVTAVWGAYRIPRRQMFVVHVVMFASAHSHSLAVSIQESFVDNSMVFTFTFNSLSLIPLRGFV